MSVGFCIGPVHKKDVMKASVMLEKKKEYATILAFDVKVTQEARELSDELGVKFRVYIDTIKEEKKERKLLKKQSFPDCTELCLQHKGKYMIKF
ncbi:hypothetical protein H5410_029906 [Solanum commersonii]|uniref:Translation initiation factor IF- 2 domain-containing protein n=1 Tax=Solanum commersonii TaxID=4109 RepID=A0A9J5YFZ6_SOLCO|nr:hypothetical protein H5410_029906 [Solanum commersonii]